MTNRPEPSSAATLSEIAWETRPDGARFFRPSVRHLYDSSIDLDAVARLHTLCKVEVPLPVLRRMRGGSSHMIAAQSLLLDDRDAAAQRP